MADRTTAGKDFLKGVLQHLPDELRAAMEAHIADPNAAAPLLTYAGDGALRQADYSSQMDTLRRERDNLTTYARQLDEYRKTVEAADPSKHAPDPTAPVAPVVPAAGSLTMDQVEAHLATVLNRRETHYARFTGDMTRIVAEHQKHFGEVLDPNTLLEHPKVGDIGLDGAWRDLHKPKFEKLATDTLAAERARIKTELRAELVAEQAQLPAYPIAGGSPLDGMGGDVTQFTPEAAARAYQELVAGPGR